MSDDYPIPTDAGGFFRRESKRAMQQARRPSFRGIKEELGPGIAPRAIQVLDWNSEECTFNGYFYSVPGALSSPDPAVRWFGEVWAQDDYNGVQTIREAEPPEAEAPPPPPPDPSANAPTPENPEPEPPTEGNPTPIRAFTRYFSVSEEGYAKYTDWEPVGSGSGGALRDLSDVHIFEPLLHHDVLLWNANYNDGEGAWNNYPFIPGLYDLQIQIDELLEEMEELIDIQDAQIRVYRQPGEPVPGVDGVEDPIPPNSIWFDTDDGHRMRVWNGTAWVQVDDALFADLQGQINTLVDQVTQVTSDTAAVITDMANINDVVIPAIAAQATQAVNDATAAIEAAGGWQEIGAITATMIADDAISTPELHANAITSKHTMIAPTYKTVTNVGTGSSPNVVPGVLINSAGLVVYGPTGPTLTVLASNGSISMVGALTSGSSITGATVTGGTVTGALLQTVATSSRGIKITSTGMTIYNSVGTPTLTVDANGVISMLGSLTSGSVITGATINSPLIQTSTTPAVGVKFTTGGIVGYGGGIAKFVLDTSGNLNLTGSLVTGGDINGATVTGGTVQSSATPNRGVKFNSNGLVAYSDGSIPGLAAGAPTVTFLASTGAAAFRGAITSGSTVTGAEVIGGQIKTSSAFVNSIHMGMGAGSVEGLKVFNSGGSMLLYIRPDTNTTTPVLTIQGGLRVNNPISSTPAVALHVTGPSHFENSVTLLNGALVLDDLQLGTSCQINGSGSINIQGNITSQSGITGNNLEASGHNTTGSAANCFIRSTDGRLFRSTSSRRYKVDERALVQDLDVETILALEPKTSRRTDEEDDPDRRFPSFMAEDAADLGLDLFLEWDEEGRPDNFAVAHWPVAQQVVLRALWAKAQEQAAEIADLRDQIAEIWTLLPPGKVKK